MKVSPRRTAGAWLCVLLFLLLGATNSFATVLCIEPDGTAALETTDTHGRCAPCPGSAENNNGQPQPESATDNCVDLGVVNSPDVKPAETIAPILSEFSDAGVALQFASWFSAIVQIALADLQAPVLFPETSRYPSDSYFARSVVLLV